MKQGPGKSPIRSLVTVTVAGIGLIICAVGFIFALIGEGTASLVPGVTAIVLGLVASAVGGRRLGAVTLFIGLFVIFFGIAASQGMIPGLSKTDHDYPEDIPQRQTND